MTYGKFKDIIRAMGGMWAGPGVRFSRSQSEFHAACGDEWVHLLVPGGLWSAKGPDAERRMCW